jgi:hypothetical protein
MVKTLGLLYLPETDAFSIGITKREEIIYTISGILSVAASLYVPMGWILPVVMKFRMLVQELWLQGLDWDDHIEGKTRKKIDKCIENIHELRSISIPRWTENSYNSAIELIGFSDASIEGFAAVVYSRVKVSSGYLIWLVASKGRVTPLKIKANVVSNLCTNPKFELEGLVLLANIMANIVNSMENL